MKRTNLIAVLVGLAIVALFAADASAMYHPTVGRFMQRDPGPGGPMRVGAGGPVAGGRFIQRDPNRESGLLLGNVTGISRINGNQTLAPRGLAGAVSVMPEPGCCNLYVYADDLPTAMVDPTGLVPVDPYKDCHLAAKSDWAGKKPVHFWIGGEGNEVWDYGPDIKDVRRRYGSDDYSNCGLLVPCAGEAPYGGGIYGGKPGTQVKPLKLQGEFLFFEAKLQAGPKKDTVCKCATCDDIKGCLKAVMGQWNGTNYDHWFHSCLNFVMDAKSKCCLRE